MIKRKATIITLVLAGAMIFTGVGGLFLCMAHARGTETVTQLEKENYAKQEASIEKVETATNQKWLEEESFYLPEDAEMEETPEGCYLVSWKGYEILIERDDKFTEGWYEEIDGESIWVEEDNVLAKESEDDIGLAKLIPILENAVSKYSGQDMYDANISVRMYDDFEEDYPDLAKTYHYQDKYYEVDISGVGDYNYHMCVNSITGEILEYDHYDESRYDCILALDDNYNLPEEQMEECKESANEFLNNELGHGHMADIHSQQCLTRVGENSERTIYVVVCTTESGDVVTIEVDAGDKSIQGFSVNGISE